MKRVFIFLFLMGIVSPVTANAPSVWGIWGGAGLGMIPFGTLRGSELHGRGLTLLALHYGRILIRGKNASLLYTLDVLPAVIAEGSEVTIQETNGERMIGRKTVYGFGANPIGFQLDFGTNHVWRPFAFITGGFLRFEKPTPTPRATRWNFSTDAGGGVQFLLHDRKSISIGYRLHHFSNAGSGRANPSLNTNVIYFGLNFFR
jgi:Opacity protein and related surface antigens